MKKTEKNKKNKINKKEKTNNKPYISFGTRLFLCILSFAFFLILGIVFVFMSLNFKEQKTINYSEKSNLDYRVYLKQNDFYDTEYMGKNMIYVASLIDKVRVDFKYDFMSDENISLDFNYKIMGKLSITDATGKNSYFEKDYVLLDNRSVSLKENNNQKINESIDIDYGYYNSIANRFKTSYGVDSSSKFTLYFVIDKDSSDDNSIIKNSSLMSISIPLSERAVNITMDYKDIDTTSSLISESNLIINSIIDIIVAIIMIIISLIMAVKTIRLLKLIKTDKNKYDKYINKILKEYDRLIVETSTQPIINGDNVIKINKFQELLDVRDNLKLPIMYYNVTKHQKCYFYITHENKIYLNVIKAVDMDEKDIK